MLRFILFGIGGFAAIYALAQMAIFALIAALPILIAFWLASKVIDQVRAIRAKFRWL